MVEQDAAVPVSVDIAGPARAQVLRVVEGALGWPVVAVDDTVLAPRCVLVDPARAGGHAGGTVPVALVTSPDDDPVLAARAGRNAVAVLDGVPDAGVLGRLVADLEDAVPTGRGAWCSVAAAAGGAGATTVATALAGLRAWRHGTTLLATSGPSHHAGTPEVTAADLASPAVWAAAVASVGVEDLRVVALRGDVVPRDAGPVPLVLDRGVVPPELVDVLVVRPDRAGLDAVASLTTGVVVAVGRGAVDLAQLRHAADDRLVVTCPWSARVAAAAAAQRSPTDLPGSWLRRLEPVVSWLDQRDGA